MGDHTFFQNRDCRFFPCHSGVKEEEFNCLFCYCPLYALGESCGGSFTYSDKGNKNCKDCIRPHEKGGYELIKSMYPLISEKAGKNPPQKKERCGMAFFAFTKAGAALGRKLMDLSNGGEGDLVFQDSILFLPAGTGPDMIEADDTGRIFFSENIRLSVSEAFAGKKALVFISAAGVAVRYISPFIRSKLTDPAVICMDEKGDSVISLLSGHMGGANELAKKIAGFLGTRAVITTATDINGMVAPDVYAKERGLHIPDMSQAKKGAARMLAGKKVSFVTTPYADPVLKEGEIHMIPRCLVLGVGCKKGTDSRALEGFVSGELSRLGLSEKAVAAVATIDIKKGEKAITDLAGFFDADIRYYTAGELRDVKGDFEASDFVKEITGVDNVCERACAAYAGEKGGSMEFLQHKICKNGMTLAVGRLLSYRETGPDDHHRKKVRAFTDEGSGDASGHLKVLLFAGTTEGRMEAQRLMDEGADLTVCTATGYGASLIPEGCRVLSGRLDENEIYRLLTEEGFDKVVDATHPYALEVTKNARQAAERAGVLYERIERESSGIVDDGRVQYFDSLSEAVEYLRHTEGNILSAIGIKGLSQLTLIEGYEERIYARILPECDNLAKAGALGFKGRHIICMQGPFGEKLNRALMEELDIRYMLTKESGRAGGFEEKIAAALLANVKVLVIKRPGPADPSGDTREGKGWGKTTGTCAAMAARAAAVMALTGEVIDRISLILPGGEKVWAMLSGAELTDNGAFCGVRKESSGDIDVTVGLTVYAKLMLTKEPGIRIDGGEGIGVVTRQGLSLKVGEKAINPGPRSQIETAVSGVFEAKGYEGGALVTISVPGGEDAAKKTFNPRLGIEGGISILGTTGIVRPMSRRAFIEAMEVQMNVIRALGDEIVITPGSIGEELVKTELHISEEKIAQCSNFVGEALDMACRKGFKRIRLAGSLGKLVKVAAGIMDTHSKTADGRMEVLGVYAAMAGAGQGIVERIMKCISTDEALGVIEEAGIFRETMEGVTRGVFDRCLFRCGDNIDFGVLIFSGDGKVIGKKEF